MMGFLLLIDSLIRCTATVKHVNAAYCFLCKVTNQQRGEHKRHMTSEQPDTTSVGFYWK